MSIFSHLTQTINAAIHRTITIMVPGATTGAVRLERINPTIDQTAPLVHGAASFVNFPYPPANAINVHVTADGFQPVTHMAAILPVGSGAWTLPETLTPLFRPMPRIVARGKFFATETGERLHLRDCTDFALFGRYCAGEDIRPVLKQRQDLGFNCRRVFLFCDVPGIGTFTPTMYPDWATKLGPFADRLATHGSYLNLVVGAWPYTWTSEYVTWMHETWQTVGVVLKDKTNVIVSLVNENNDGENRQPLDVTQFPPLDGLLCSPGSVDSGQWPPNVPGYAWTELHTLQDEFWRKSGHNAMEVADAYGKPCHTSERQRQPDHDRSEAHSEDDFAGSALLNAGDCFHSPSGKLSVLFSADEARLAAAATRGAMAVPLDCQDGGYVHRQDLEGADYLRVYQRGSADACIVRIRP